MLDSPTLFRQNQVKQSVLFIFPNLSKTRYWLLILILTTSLPSKPTFPPAATVPLPDFFSPFLAL